EQFVDFMRENHDNIKAEYPIPNVIAHLMSRGEARVKVLHSDAEWFGVTYKEDRPYVVERLAQLPD
ncbi:MAG: nucleotidyltransferase, partial [Bacteroidales bacterium]|nr:nucleotidyltransferase [Bacteroidales bacterium]